MLLTIMLILCAVLLLLLFMLLPGESSFEKRRPFWGRNFAHRGLHTKDKTIPENSLAAFTAAVDAGYGIELDIHISKDRKVVVFHDDDLVRMCGKEGRIDSYTYEQLSEFRLLETNQSIPLLRDVLNLVDGKVPLVIELKTSFHFKELCEQAWNVLRTYDGDFCIESFDPRILHWFRKRVPGILRGQLTAPPKQLKNGVLGFVVGTLLCNFLGRPQFIAYQIGRRPVTAWFAEKFAMRVAWTAHLEDSPSVVESQTDAVIFEFYEPEPFFKEPPSGQSPS